MKTTITPNQIFRNLFRLQRSCWSAVFLLVFLLSASSSWGQIAQRGSATTASSATTNNTTITINKPSGVVAGDVLLFSVVQSETDNDNGGLSSPTLSGWTLVKDQLIRSDGTSNNNNAWFGSIYYRVADGSEGASFTFAMNSRCDMAIGSMVAFSGVACNALKPDGSANGPFDIIPVNFTTANSATATATGVTVATNNSAVIMFAMCNNDRSYSSWSNSQAELFDNITTNGDDASVGAAWLSSVNSGATGNRTVTLSASDRNSAILLVLRRATTLSTSAASATPSLCQNTALTNITHTTVGATGISNSGVSGANGLPVGVSAAWASNTITISGTPTASGTFNYSIPLTGGCNSVNATGTITVTAPPSAGTLSGTQELCPNGTTTLSSSVSGGTWLSDATEVATINSATGVVTGVAAGTATMTYTIIGTGGCANATATRIVTVNSILTTSNATICAGESGSLSVTSSCADLTEQTAGANLPGTGATAGTGTAWSNPTRVTSNDNSNATVSLTAGGTGNSTSTSQLLSATGFGFSIPANAIINGITANIGRFRSNSGNIRDARVQLLKAGSSTGANLAVTGTNWPTSETVAVYGSTTNLWNESWTAADINSSNFGIGISTTQTVSFFLTTRANIDYINLTITYTIPGSLQWYTVSSGGTAIGSGANFNPVGVANSGLANTNTAGTTSYWVECSTAVGGCRAKADFTINPSPTVTVSPDQSICAGSDATISASGATSYEWSNALGTASSVTVSPTTTTTYTVTGTAANGCTNTANTTVTVNPIQLVSVSIEASTTIICPGTSVTFNATATNGGTAPLYQWKVNGINVGSNSVSFTSSTLVNGDVVTCVMTSNANVCLSGSPATSNSIPISVNTPVGITAITPTTNPIAPTQTTTITATGVVGTGALVSWYSGPNQTGTAHGTGLTSNPVGPGTYYAYVTGTCGSAIELSTTISPLASWTGNVNTLWHVTGNWAEGVLPTAATNVVIGDGKVVEISSADAVANTITINGSGTLTVQSGRTVTVTNAINTTSATQFVLENNANLLQGGTTNQNAGPITVKRNSSSIIRLDYTLWSSPVASQGLYAFSKTTLPNRFYRYDTNTNFYTNSVGFNLTNLQYPSPLVAPNGINGTDENNVTFAAGKGYLIRVPWNHPTAPTSWTGNFTGVPNNGTITYTMSDFGAGQRFNLVGNPYPSPISISQFIQDNQANITSSIYFWRKTNGSSSDTYCEWNDEIFTDNSDAQSFDPGDTIRTGQGFFVEGTGAGTALVFNNGQRVNDTANQFFRTSATTTLSNQNVFWLNLTGSNAQFSQTAIAYKSYATNGIDRYDAKRIAPGTISLTSIVEGNNLAIQSKSDFVNTDVVPLSYVVATAGSYSITLDNKNGIFSTGQTIYLRDRLLNVDFNLASGSYTFVSEAGTFDNRFEIVYQTNSLGVTNPIFNESQVVIYKSRSNELSINTGNFVMSSVKIFDISGRLLFEKKDIDASQALLNIGLATEVLLVQITSNDGVVVTKKVLFPRTSLKLDKKIEVKTQLAEDE